MSAFFIVLIALMLALLTLLMQITVSVRLTVDIIRKKGYVSVFLFGISILKLDFDIDLNMLMANSGNQSKEVAVQGGGKGMLSIWRLVVGIIQNIDFIHFDIGLSIGISSDAFLTAMSLQLAQIIIAAVIAKIKSGQDLDIKEKYIPVYGKDELKLDFYGIISMSLISIIVSVLGAVRKRKKAANRKEKVR